MSKTSFSSFPMQRAIRVFALAASVCGVGLMGGACTVTSTPAATADGGVGATDSGSVGDGSAADAGPYAFAPSNISLAGIDLTAITDVDLSTDCAVDTDVGPTAGGTCLTNAAETTLTQSDGSKVHVFVVKSLKVEPAAHLSINGPAAGLPLVIVALGDMTILGTFDAHAAGDTAYGGGFQSTQDSQKGAGPGGGPAATGTGGSTLGAGGGGGSYCGKGGQGALEATATPPASAATAPYGTPEIVPLIGGSSGGAGTFGAGAGGGAVQLVAFGAFSMGAGSYINVGGGGGRPAVSSNTGDNSGGGGSGGSLLIEASTVSIAGILAANGGGGGGVSADGKDATPDATPALGGANASVGAGGVGSGGAGIDGATPAAVTPGPEGGGGGGSGRIRINTVSGVALITAATLSPAAMTACMTQGKVH